MSFPDDADLVDPPPQPRFRRRSASGRRKRWLWRGALALLALVSIWFLVQTVTTALAGTVSPASSTGGTTPPSQNCLSLGNGGKTIQRGTGSSTPPPGSTVISCASHSGAPGGGHTMHGTPPSGTDGGK